MYNKKSKSFYYGANSDGDSSGSGMNQSHSLQDFKQMRESLEESERGKILIILRRLSFVFTLIFI